MSGKYLVTESTDESRGKCVVWDPYTQKQVHVVSVVCTWEGRREKIRGEEREREMFTVT
jgi:hypothetical protein